MSTKIVVGIDGSSHAAKALGWAMHLAAPRETAVIPVLVWEYPRVPMSPYPIDFPEVTSESLQTANCEAAAALIARAIEESGLSNVTEPIVVRGRAGTELCRVAEDADLLVLGSRGLGGFAGLVLGSVSAHCANAAACPVAVVPDTVLAEPKFDEVYVGVDESENASEAIDWADEWAPESATLHLVHAWQLPIVLDGYNNWIDEDTCTAAATRLVATAAKQVDDHEVECIAAQTDARSDLVKLASQGDLLVIGARTHRGIGRLLLGSVASAAIHHLEVPTVVVPPVRLDR